MTWCYLIAHECNSHPYAIFVRSLRIYSIDSEEICVQGAAQGSEKFSFEWLSFSGSEPHRAISDAKSGSPGFSAILQSFNRNLRWQCLWVMPCSRPKRRILRLASQRTSRRHSSQFCYMSDPAWTRCEGRLRGVQWETLNCQHLLI
jgi:hypothetical protein